MNLGLILILFVSHVYSLSLTDAISSYKTYGTDNFYELKKKN
jgi:hypothetical protein